MIKIEQILKVSRQELKYLINDIEASLLKRNLKDSLIEDLYNKDDQGYMIRSLYFDSYSNADFYEKMDGIEDRKKIRLRIYSTKDSTAKLEIKRKYGNNQIKQSVKVSKEDALELIKCNYEVLNKYTSPTAVMIKNIMKTNRLIPVVLIEYNRTAFMHTLNNIRVTVDTDIRSSETDFRLFSDNVKLVPIEPFKTTVVEVKYDGYLLGWINAIISKYHLTRTSFSKYQNSRFIFESYLS
ncbi:MAG: polyphosphate polymerase domain-containing protein [Bacilli bacterium]|nr:polyphosphate polymerase domain-containing protein [Bacilli bacterium]MDD4719146.1 polyphosphate polymerase domain-containing protein [Bacilli bacterium]